MVLDDYPWEIVMKNIYRQMKRFTRVFNRTAHVNIFHMRFSLTKSGYMNYDLA